MVQSGCFGVLIGFEIMPENLIRMNKGLGWNSVQDMETSIKLIHQKGLRIYATFLSGYDHDTKDDFNTVLDLYTKQDFYGRFNHLTPFPEQNFMKD
ncbi:MAG: hypothetical protein MZV63_57930 [Marinilabiliales bacterium]|nr:hypothetical protein [Marinilabiliales bacterium]